MALLDNTLLVFSRVIILTKFCQSVVSQKKKKPADDDSFFKPIIIPWLQKEQKDEGRQESSPDELPVEEAPREAAKEDIRDGEEKGLVRTESSYIAMDLLFFY